MAASRTQFVHQGAYVDYGRSTLAKHQWLWSTQAATIWTNFLGILVTITGARLFRLVLRIRALADAGSHRNHQAGNLASLRGDLQAPVEARDAPSAAPSQVPTSVEQSEQAIHRLDQERDETALESRGWHTLLGLIWDSKAGAVRFPGVDQLNTRRSKQVVSRLLKCFTYLGIYVGILICGLLTAQLVSDSTALSASPDCGYYLPSNTTGIDDVSFIVTPYEHQTQLDSADWARSCYHADDGTDGCKFFLQRSINYTMEHNDSCPFPDYMCHGGALSALAFSTGPVNATEIGINAPRTWEFERNTTCSPLNMNETARTTGGLQTWNPTPELQPPADASTTIMFILPRKIFYQAPSTDPIFPANRLRYFQPSKTPYWTNDLGHATVLACVDRTSWRDPDGDNTWQSLSAVPALVQDPHVRGGTLLLWYSLWNSIIYQTVSHRLTSALDAQRLLIGYISLPLAAEQWKVELTQLWETSLARTVMDARNVARGVMAGYPGFRKADIDASMCEGTYVFKSEGWVNVNKTISLVILMPCLVIIFFAIPIDSERLVMPDLLLGCFAELFAEAVVEGVVLARGGTVWVYRKAVLGIWISGRAVEGWVTDLGGAIRRLGRG